MKVLVERPERLYKYRGFNTHTLDMLVRDVVFFADPTTFNDPLDTKPHLEPDMDSDALEGTLAKLIEKRATAEFTVDAKRIDLRGPKAVEHIRRQACQEAKQILEELRNRADGGDFGDGAGHQHRLCHYIREELIRRYDNGVLSLAVHANCPLMWSHYGDQHRGLCVGYSIPSEAAGDLHQVCYDGSRLIPASTVARMLDGDAASRRDVDDAVLLRKAKPWAYEREWRMIRPKGEHSSPLELEEVVFGLRCAVGVKFAVAKALERRERSVKLYEIYERNGSFDLDMRDFDFDREEISTHFPRRSLTITKLSWPIRRCDT